MMELDKRIEATKIKLNSLKATMQITPGLYYETGEHNLHVVLSNQLVIMKALKRLIPRRKRWKFGRERKWKEEIPIDPIPEPKKKSDRYPGDSPGARKHVPKGNEPDKGAM